MRHALTGSNPNTHGYEKKDTKTLHDTYTT
jgi:hypothetical protein